METKSAGELTDFCLVLTPTDEAVEEASTAIRYRFDFLGGETREELVAAVVGRVEKSLWRGAPEPITVTVSLDDGVIHGEVSNHGEPLSFELPLSQTS